MSASVHSPGALSWSERPPASRIKARDFSLVVAGFAVACLAILAAGQGALLRILFPAGALVIGLFLFEARPLTYVSFVWSLWFLTPFIRRVSDFQGGWTDPNPILLAPLLATIVPAVYSFTRRPCIRTRGALPFLLAFVAVLYGTIVGVLRLPPAAVLSRSLVWFSPILFGFAICQWWRFYPAMSDRIRATFRWGGLATAIYGLIQFVVAPAWDQHWMIQSGLLTTGSPEPFAIRVFSTMNTPGPFGATMMASILLLTVESWFALLTSGSFAFAALLLTQSRTAWLGWAGGMLVVFFTARPLRAIRLLAIMLAVAICLVPVCTLEPVRSTIESRFESLLHLDQDVSRADRTKGYEKLWEVALREPFGKGIGVMDIEYGGEGGDEGGPHDSAFLELLLSLGWFGAALYLTGLGILLVGLVQDLGLGHVRSDAFAAASRAIALAMLVEMTLSSTMIGVSGALLWGFAGISVAGREYQRFSSE